MTMKVKNRIVENKPMFTDAELLDWFYCLNVAQTKRVKRAVKILMSCGIGLTESLRIIRDGRLDWTRNPPARIALRG
jgi:hypothetical protein